MRRFFSIAGTAAALGLLAACGSQPPTAAPPPRTTVPTHSSTPATTTSLTGPPPPPIQVDPKYVPSWMQGMATNPNDPSAQAQASVGLARVQSDLAQNGLGSLQDLPDFPQRVVRQCAALNAGVADPDGEAVQSFSIPARPLSPADATRINAVIRKDCA